MTNSLTIDELIGKVEQWSVDRNINHASPLKQFDKLVEEHGELVRGLNKQDMQLIKDSIGDMFVVLIIMMQQIKGNIKLALSLSDFGEGEVNTLNYIKSLFYLGEKLEDFMSDNNNGNLFSEIQTLITNITYLLKERAYKNSSDLRTCLALAYDEIKNRKGEMIDGKFVKDSDLNCD
ncbi:TPA: MazG-like family protein [Staphylococcus aureus]|nr:MazG-like family protein [Staphylococcus aureus]